MEKKRKKVMIQLHTDIEDEGEHETVTESHEGTYFRKGDQAVVMYIDRQNQLGEIKNIITIHSDKLSVKRSGAVAMHQVFIVDKQTECMYRHPYGRFLMDIKTNTLEVSVTQEKEIADVVVVYDMLFQGTKRHFKLTMEFMEVQ